MNVLPLPQEKNSGDGFLLYVINKKVILYAVTMSQNDEMCYNELTRRKKGDIINKLSNERRIARSEYKKGIRKQR